MVPQPFRVVEKRRDTEDTWTLELAAADGAAGPPPFEPGQFNMIYAFGVGEIPISICGAPTATTRSLEHTVRSVGAVSAAICAATAGDTLGVRGPFGSSWPLDAAKGRDLVIVAGGIGLAPLRPALLAALARRDSFGRLVLLYGGRSPDQLLYREQLEHWQATDDLEVGITVDSAAGDWGGEVGVVTKLIADAGFDPHRSVAMLVGPEVMMRFAIRALRDRGVGTDRIYVSIERNMKCAIVSCGHCQFGPTFACREGPVMRIADIEPFFSLREV
jgi:NAD(P)H-flavin reductase